MLFLRCTDNLMTSWNIATVFAPCLLPPPNKAEMSESRLELRVQVLHAFIENPHLFGKDNILLFWSCYCLGFDQRGFIYLFQASSLKVSWTVWNFWWMSSFPRMRKRDTGEDTAAKVNYVQMYFGSFFFNVPLGAPECHFPQVLRSVKTMPWVKGRSSLRTTMSGPKHGSISGDRKPLRRSLGLESFPNVLMFRNCVPHTGKKKIYIY